MTTAVTVRKPEGNAVAFYSIRNMDYDAIVAKLDEEMPESGKFPGDALTFDGKRGQWKWGYGKKGQVFDHSKFSFVFNMPNAVEGWQRFAEEGGKMFPLFGDMVFICDPMQKRKTREELGDNDPERWATDTWGKKSDPWKQFVAVPIRIDGEDTVQHLFLGTISGVIAFKGLLREFAQQGRSHIGKLPVVNLSRGTRERKDNKAETFDIPVFEIVDWIDPIAADLPNDAEQQAAAVAIPEANVRSVERQTAVENLQDEANKSAQAEANATSATVHKIAEGAGAAPAGNSQRRTAPGGASTPSAPAPGMFGGVGSSRRNSGGVNPRATVKA